MKAKEMVCSAGVQAPSIIEELRNFNPDEKILEKLVNYMNSIKMRSTEELYNRLFQDIMRHSKDYFDKLSWISAVVMAIKFVEVVV